MRGMSSQQWGISEAQRGGQHLGMIRKVFRKKAVLKWRMDSYSLHWFINSTNIYEMLDIVLYIGDIIEKKIIPSWSLYCSV